MSYFRVSCLSRHVVATSHDVPLVTWHAGMRTGVSLGECSKSNFSVVIECLLPAVFLLPRGAGVTGSSVYVEVRVALNRMADIPSFVRKLVFIVL
jgi:hypothetical protein